jgi:hypothetical protein
MAVLPAPPDIDPGWVLRVSPDPYTRFDTCDYSLNPALVGHHGHRPGSATTAISAGSLDRERAPLTRSREARKDTP